jgi:Fe-S cluster biogenesis protein NfuA
MQVQLKLAGFCPSCGERAEFTPIGSQETLDGAPIALGNCDQCGSTVALQSVESTLRALWPEPTTWHQCREWKAMLRASLPPSGYVLTITCKADDLGALVGCIRDATRELARLGAR